MGTEEDWEERREMADEVKRCLNKRYKDSRKINNGR